MSSNQEQPQKPVTYGDIFQVHGEVAAQPVTVEDAAMMQSAEVLAVGKISKGGPASAMQSAADHNVKAGLVEKGAHSPVADQGVSVVETFVPGMVLHAEYVAGQPILASAEPTPTAPAIAAQQDAVTIGEALEAVAVGMGDQPIEESDARAIQSAEKRALGIPVVGKGGLSATAQAAAELNPRVEDFAKTTFSDVLADASIRLASDKAVTREDAEKVSEAERRATPTGDVRQGGVASAVVAAAELNEKGGLFGTTARIKQLQVEEGVPQSPSANGV